MEMYKFIQTTRQRGIYLTNMTISPTDLNAFSIFFHALP